MAGFGVIKCLVKENDHIVLDQLAHNCLWEGARAATKNCYRVKHLCNKAMEEKISELRQTYPD
jgi:7-keto-8-aminopelargonate synthetase-like enzyme